MNRRSGARCHRATPWSGVERVIYTDIERDGTLTSPNFEAVVRWLIRIRVIASGGVSSLQDLQTLAAIPVVEAAIVGKALYEGDDTDRASERMVDKSSGERQSRGER